MRNNLILCVMILLSACASTPAVIAPVIQKVEVPIAVPCKVDVPGLPNFSFDMLSTEQDIFDKTRALLADRKLHIGYETELSAALKSCMK